MEHRTFFKPSERYEYDWGMCSAGNGFAQVDTYQDAWYFGTWANPETRIIVCYTEGDVTIDACDTDEEFCKEIHAIKAFYSENAASSPKSAKSADGFRGIDPMGVDSIKAHFQRLGLGDLLH